MNSIAVYGRLPWAVAALALLVLGAVLSLFPAFACWIAKKIGGGRLATELPALAGVWTLAEWLRGDALANFGWLMPGYAVIHAACGLGPAGRHLRGHARTASLRGARRRRAQLSPCLACGARHRCSAHCWHGAGLPTARLVGAVLHGGRAHHSARAARGRRLYARQSRTAHRGALSRRLQAVARIRQAPTAVSAGRRQAGSCSFRRRPRQGCSSTASARTVRASSTPPSFWTRGRSPTGSTSVSSCPSANTCLQASTGSSR